MPDKFINAKTCECIESMERMFWYDTVTLLDCVLTDDRLNPEYSANTVLNRLSCVLHFQTYYYGDEMPNVPDLMLKNGYSIEDVALLNQKCSEENERYSRTRDASTQAAENGNRGRNIEDDSKPLK